MNKFTGHIHVHSMYSALDGLAKIEELVIRAKKLGQTFIALTDHGNSSAFYEAMEYREKHGIDILFGEEFYFQNDIEDIKTGHLILLAKNQTGLENIFKLQREAYNNVYYKPRINLELLEKYNEGLICTTACIANQVGQLILRDEVPLAINHLKELQRIFKEDFYVELQSSTMKEVIKVNKALLDICGGFNFKPIITNDVHYVEKEDHEFHDVLLCIQQRKKVADKKRWRFENNDYWLKDEEELMAELKYLPSDFVGECFKNIEEIHQKCENVEIRKGNFLPYFCKTREEETTKLHELTMQGYVERLAPKGECNESYINDLRGELDVIQEEGYCGYFLIVNEYVNWAKNNGIVVGDGRGSGAGSKVAYALGITEINPQTNGLLFERFLSKGREPDFDTDFSDIDAVFLHLQERFGKDNVARVGAFSTFTCKSATRKIMSAYGFTQTMINNIVEQMPQRLSFTLQDCLDESKELNKWFSEHKNIQNAVAKFEGIIDHFSTHAGGVLICEGLTSMLPVLTVSEDRDKLIVALDKNAIESLGHFKFDILGLKSLNIIKEALEHIDLPDLHNIDLEDENIYNMLCAGEVTGVFQLAEQQVNVIEQQPRNFEDLIAINALIRPGVGDWKEYIRRRRSGECFDSTTSPYLNSTSGIIVYQEQYLLLAQTYAGWDIAYSDKNIRKNKDIMNDDELHDLFIKDSLNRGYELQEVEEIWDDICHVIDSGYGFNRAHSASYARLTYNSAYLKYYYTKEFYSAYMTQNITDAIKITEGINLVRSEGVKILPPDINNSSDRFKPSDEGILYPLTCIRGVGSSAWDEIVKLRPIVDLDDLIKRRTPRSIKRNTLEALVKSGSFDYLERTRFDMLKEIESNFKPTEEELVEEPIYKYEKEVLDLYLSSSPFDGYDIKPFNQTGEGSIATTILEITEVVERKDRTGKVMAFLTGSNNTDTLKILVFASVWVNNMVEKGDLVLIKGKSDKGNLLANYIEKVGDKPNDNKYKNTREQEVSVLHN